MNQKGLWEKYEKRLRRGNLGFLNLNWGGS